MTFDPEDCVKLLVAVLVGGLIGAEREFRDKAAGFRTLIFICTGSTLFTIISHKLGGPGDPARIAAQIVTGVGFLGAGVIMRDGSRVMGLTTASAVWLTAALGMGVGAGAYAFIAVATAVALVVLWAFPSVEAWIDNLSEERTYEVICTSDPATFERLGGYFTACGLRVRGRRQVKAGERLTCTWQARGAPPCHERLMKLLLTDPDVKEVRF